MYLGPKYPLRKKNSSYLTYVSPIFPGILEEYSISVTCVDGLPYQNQYQLVSEIISIISALHLLEQI